MKQQFLAIAAVGMFAAVTTAVPARANVTYFYDGSATPQNSRDGGIASYIDQNAPITFGFTVASLLAANLSAFDIKASTLSWTASGGKPQSTVGSTDLNAFLSRVWLSTDATGNITYWNIVGSANVAALPGDNLQFYFDSVSGPHETLKWYPANGGLSLGGAASVSTAGTFAQVSGAQNAVPEPTTWALLLAGSAIAGAAVHRHRSVKLDVEIA